MHCFVSGVGVLAAGIEGWAVSEAILAGRVAYAPLPLTPRPPDILPPAERRRVGFSARLAVLVSLEAARAANEPPETLASVFGSSNGDPAVIHAILEALATPEKQVSPTQFHNSVHNAAAGYWGIGTGSRADTTSIGCHDFTFGATMLQAAAEVASQRRAVLACVYDAPMPEPLAALRPTPAPFAAAFVLTPERRKGSVARLALEFAARPARRTGIESEPCLIELMHANPAARSLPLLALLARRRAGVVETACHDGACLTIEVEPCLQV
ncbi:MAG TPA: beta-ketoacyl synthase chain length factor [Alphaproteobacteria bacterium]|nr:beta-ketoacyl synthase chain length factor [Alphaproteobacteria bacterium]